VTLWNKVLIFLEPPNFALWESLKSILSHDAEVSHYRVVEKINERHTTIDIQLIGWPAFVFCSAKSEDTWDMWPEIESRCHITTPSSTSEKYLEANRLTGVRNGLPSCIVEEIYHHSEMQDSARVELQVLRDELKEMFRDRSDRQLIFNPYREWIVEEFPHQVGRDMRALDHFLGYVNMSALENWKYRPRVFGNPRAPIIHEIIIASWEDIERAVQAFSAGRHVLNPDKMRFFNDVILPAWNFCFNGEPNMDAKLDGEEKHTRKGPAQELTTKVIEEFARKVERPIGGGRLRHNYLEPLEDVGLISTAPSEDDKRANSYVVNEIVRNNGVLRQFRKDELPRLEKVWNDIQTTYGKWMSEIRYESGSMITTKEAFIGSVSQYRIETEPAPDPNKLTEPQNGEKSQTSVVSASPEEASA
jgi:hypothetical protein